MDEEILRKAGLTEGEIKVYIALLSLGASSVGKILEKSRITKSIIYRVLDRLIEKGLVSYIIKEKTKYYQASPPHNILDYLDKQSKDIQTTKKKVETIIPQLANLQTITLLNQATIYEGFKGIMTVYEKRFEKLKAGDEYLNLGLPATQPTHHHAFWQKDHAERVQRKIKAKLLYNPQVDNATLKSRNKYWGCDARRMPLDVETPSWILIYKNTVVIAIPQGDNPIAIEIVSKEIAESFSKYFNWFWEKSKKLKN
ncbi:MAG: helix-turn-helix domain-containing protein [Candidatus Woesearchaeota archaeon]|jgi:predicted transcriptional regulator